MNLMLRLTVSVTLLFCLASCSDSNNKPVVIDKRISPPEPDKDLREKYEAQQKAKACTFDNPDTSLSGINLRDPKSVTAVLKVAQLNGDTTYHFHSKNNKEDLGVTVHPGDGYSQVSIFQVRYADNSKAKATPLDIEHFTTEKGIKLGLTKKEVVARLGNCFTTSDSAKNSIAINYRLESPQDSKTKLLERQNIPIYYATYKFIDNKLIKFEFGFEYP
jgi:hypothetical protein